MKPIGILLFDGVEEFDVAGLWEVLSYWCRMFPDDGYSVVSLSRTGESVRRAQGSASAARPARTPAAGVSAGIDMALYLVSRLATVVRAQLIRRVIQYEPHPPL